MRPGNRQERSSAVERGCIFCLHSYNSVVDILALSGSLRSVNWG
ncbi:RGD1565622 (predicted) [Rattus norvegicus]|uniref:RGD1565622 (Predicted) n=1 Tax=Rattus norvegicus TaxID=10116 RepID=A6IU23_RAT|nr:RGD1565622 (predicted) [Rattus norvegicus]